MKWQGKARLIEIFLCVITLFAMVSCNQKGTDIASEEAQVLNSSTFYPGEKTPEAELEAQSIEATQKANSDTRSAVKDGGFIGAPAGGNGGSDTGVIPQPGSGSSTGSTSSNSPAPSDSTSSGSTASTSPSSSSTDNSAPSSPTVTQTNPTVSGTDTGSIPTGSGNAAGGNDTGNIPPGGSSNGNDTGAVAQGNNGGSSTGGSTSAGSGSTGNGSSTAGTSSGTSSGGSSTASGSTPPSGSASGGTTATSNNPSGSDTGSIPNGTSGNGSDQGSVSQTGGTSGNTGGSNSGNPGSTSTGNTAPSGSNGSGNSSSSGTTASNGTGGSSGNSPVSNSTGNNSASTSVSNNGNPSNPSGSDGGTIPNGTSGNGSDQGNTTGVASNTPHGNNGVGNGVDPQPPGNPPVNDGPGTGPGNPGNNDNCKSKSCGPKTMKVAVGRVCSYRRSQIPYPKFVFFEEAKNPILTLEAMKESVACDEKPMSLASMIPMLGKPEKQKTVMVKSVDLSEVDLLKAKFETTFEVALEKIKSEVNNWKKLFISTTVCDDTDKDGYCSDEKSANLLSIEPSSFKLDHIPQSMKVEVWSGRHFTRKEDPDVCEKQYSPLILDLMGNGVSLVGPESGVYFDLNASGESIRTGWVRGADDAFLVRDVNGNGRIDSGAELFGSATVLSDGTRAPNGFEALRELDSDGDGHITPEDRDWNSLRLWVDKNSNGTSERGEIFSPRGVKLESINLTYIESSEVDPFGNQTRQRSTFRRMVRGKSTPLLIVDVWFNTLVSQDDRLASQ